MLDEQYFWWQKLALSHSAKWTFHGSVIYNTHPQSFKFRLNALTSWHVEIKTNIVGHMRKDSRRCWLLSTCAYNNWQQGNLHLTVDMCLTRNSHLVNGWKNSGWCFCCFRKTARSSWQSIKQVFWRASFVAVIYKQIWWLVSYDRRKRGSTSLLRSTYYLTSLFIKRMRLTWWVNPQ